MLMLGGAAASLSAQTAQLHETSDQDRRNLHYATRLSIQVTSIDPAISARDIADSRTWSVLGPAGHPIADITATYSGFQDANGNYSAASLWSDALRRGAVYRVVFTPPGGQVKTLDVAELAPDSSDGFSLEFLTDRVSLEIEALAVEADDEVGFRYDLSARLGSVGSGGAWTFDFLSQGEISTNTDSLDLQNAVTAGFAADYRTTWVTDGILGVSDREASYPIGFRLMPADIEASSDFDTVNVSVKAQIAAAVPVLDELFLGWHQLTGVERAFFPPTLFAGYAFVDELRDRRNARVDEDHRVDLEARFVFPLSDRTDCSFRWRGYQLIDQNRFLDHVEARLTFYTSESRSAGFDVSYSDGALPPEFDRTSTLTVGFVNRF
ncbi:MAG: hypothetical protein NXI31_00745 [bacterium]|nr:hypothetical protein [bacterium]